MQKSAFCRRLRPRRRSGCRGAGASGFFRLPGHDGAIDFETPGLGDDFMEAKRLVKDSRIRQEGVGDNAQFAAAIQMTHRAAQQGLRRVEAGLQAIVERRSSR